ncbi:class D sortase [Candidatus Parcubacteria bacterium]|nr:class D sortase [Candidatus Parcubacteria bacterium]
MAEPGSDTLDIKPIDPRPVAEGAQSQDGDNDAAAAESARAKIAALGEPGAEMAALAAPVLQTDSLPPANPVSPAAQERRQAKSESKSKLLPSRLKPVLTAVASFLLILAVFKSPVLFSQLGYLFNDKPTVNEQMGEALPSAAAAVPPEPIITIPKINVKAPVVYEPSIQESQIQRSLQNGVVHYGTTVKPGENGNSVIVGHSSNDWWEPGNYKFVFVLLDKLIVGDTFSINYNGTQYLYEVTEVKVVKPTDLSVLAPTAEPSVTLITCSPPGFSTNRLIIRAKQTSPTVSRTSVAKQTAPASGGNDNMLPGNAPSFTDQLGQAWSALVETIGGIFGSGGEQPEETAPRTLPDAS